MFRRRCDILFQFQLQMFFLWRVGIFSLFFLFCFYFLLKVHINFYISTFVLSKCYSSFVHATFRPFRNIQRATRISVCVTAVSKSHEFLLKVHWLSYFLFDNNAYAFTSTRHNFFPRRRKAFDFDDESMFVQRRRTLWRADLWRRRDIDFSPRLALVLKYMYPTISLCVECHPASKVALSNVPSHHGATICSDDVILIFFWLTRASPLQIVTQEDVSVCNMSQIFLCFISNTMFTHKCVDHETCSCACLRTKRLVCAHFFNLEVMSRHNF